MGNSAFWELNPDKELLYWQVDKKCSCKGLYPVKDYTVPLGEGNVDFENI